MTDGAGPDGASDDMIDDGQITAADLAFAAANDDDETVIGHATALASVQTAFAGLAKSQDVDILPAEGDEQNDIAVAGDVWTLYLNGWPGLATAFIAIEEEPAEGASPDVVEAAWREVMSPAVVAAMAVVDLDLDGALTAALDASGDPLSASIATAVRLGSVPG